MGRRILASLLTMALIFALPVFSYADRGGIYLNDSGSPEVSMMAMRSIAANDGISLAAAEGNSGQFGYNIEPYSDFSYVGPYLSDGGSRQYQFVSFYPSGSYSVHASFNVPIYSLRVWDHSSNTTIFEYRVGSTSGGTSFNIPSDGVYTVFFNFTESNLPSIDDLVNYSYSFSHLSPVEGISSGYSFNSGVKDDDDVSARLSYVDWDFGSQPAGNYLINIYTYGQNYDVNFDISVGDVTTERKLAVAKSNGLYTCLVSHGGGDLILTANFTYFKDSLNSPAGGYSSNIYYVSSGNWVFNIVDVVAVPLESAGLEQFGVFGSVVGFLRDEFSSMKSWIATQIDKIAGDDETKATVDNAASELEQEVQDLNTLSSDLTTQAGNLEQQFSTDFAIPSEISGFSGSVQSIYSFLFSSLGVFSIFIWLPIVLAVIKKLLRL